MPRKRDWDAPRVVYRTARCGLRVTRHQRSRLFGLLRSAGDVWCCVSTSGPGTFGELDSTGARSVLRRYSDAWFATANRRKSGDMTARYPRRKRGLVPVRWYSGTFTLDGRRLRVPVARGCPPLTVRLDRDIPPGTRRRHHPRHPPRGGDHAPARRRAPPRCAPGAA